MLVIDCPVCGPRNGAEFTSSGPVKARPGATTDKSQWRRYLYEQDNAAGVITERWFHVSGCRRFLDVQRHTVSNVITSVVEVGTSR